ncbi:MAG: hypothetical protein U0531_18570 [Dehalococcoidia bacterium]
MYTPAGASRLLREDDTLDGGDTLPGFGVRVADILPPAGPLLPPALSARA